VYVYISPIYDVRAYMPLYPVVPVKWVCESLGRARERYGLTEPPDIWEAPVNPEILLKWPLRNVKGNSRSTPARYSRRTATWGNFHRFEEVPYVCKSKPMLCADDVKIELL
jgi:hypothetical protein